VRAFGRQLVIKEALRGAEGLRLGARIKAVRESLGETQVESAEGRLEITLIRIGPLSR
jgi:hypothetical protein